MDTTLACTKNNIDKSSLSATAADIKTNGTNYGIVNNEDDDDNVGDQNMNPMDTEKEGKSTNKDEEQVNNVDKKSTITAVSASNMDDTDGTIVELLSNENDIFPVSRVVANMSGMIKSFIEVDDDDDDDNNEDDYKSGCHTNKTKKETKNSIQIPLPKVRSEVLMKVVEFCNHYVSIAPMTNVQRPLKSDTIADMFDSTCYDRNNKNKNRNTNKFYSDLMMGLGENIMKPGTKEQSFLFELILAANYMDIPPLLDLTCGTVATMMKNKKAEEIRTIFYQNYNKNGDNDNDVFFTPEEEAEIRLQNKWIMEV